MANEDCQLRIEENGSEPSEELCLKIQDEEPEANLPAPSNESDHNSLPEKQNQSTKSKSYLKLTSVNTSVTRYVYALKMASDYLTLNFVLFIRHRNGTVTIKLHAVGQAPILKNKRWVLERSKNLGHVSSNVRNMLKLTSSDSLFLYVDQFSPPLDTIISNLFDCHSVEGVLNISYCTVQAWG